MKKTILVLSYVFGSLALLVLIGVFIYCNFWKQSFKHMKPDSDVNSYDGYFISYNNGELSVNYNGNTELITPDSKSNVDVTSKEYKEKFDKYRINLYHNNIHIIDSDGKIAGDFAIETIAEDFGMEEETYTANMYGGLNINDEIYNLYVDMDSKLLYVEHFTHRDITTAKYNKYDLTSTKLLDSYTIEFCDCVTQGISIVRDISNCKIFEFDDYVFYVFSYSNYSSKKMYRYNKSNKTVEVAAELNCVNIAANQSEIYYTGYHDMQSYDTENKSGLWKFDIDTFEETHISDKYFDCEILCTDNYIYAYRNEDIVIPPLPSYDPVIIERGYNIEQIPIKRE